MRESGEAVLSETERETRRSEIISKLLSLEKIGVNSENWHEVDELEKELLEVNPVSGNPGKPFEITEERRRRDVDREAISRVLAAAKQFRQ